MSGHEEVEILLVEDSPSDAELAMEALKEANFANHVVWVKDGAEALDYVRAEGAYAQRPPEAMPRVILLDLRLPKVDGIEVLERLKVDERTKRIPVVVLTSSKEDRDVLRCYDRGVNSFVTKPVGFEEFAKVVAQLGLYWLLVNRTPR